MDLKMPDENPNIAGDRLNICLLTFMYVLQTLPRGIADGIAIILQRRHVSYADQVSYKSILLRAKIFRPYSLYATSIAGRIQPDHVLLLLQIAMVSDCRLFLFRENWKTENLDYTHAIFNRYLC